MSSGFSFKDRNSSCSRSCNKPLSFIQWLFCVQPLEAKLKRAKKSLKSHKERIKKLKEKERRGGKVDKKKLKEKQERVTLLKHYIALLYSAIEAKNVAAQATAEYLYQNSILNPSGPHQNLVSAGDITLEQQKSLRLLRQMQQAKEDEVAARKEVTAIEKKL